ncbi:MAG: FeoB small GTPase domain-containing protein, partial [Oscillospiraceae bacterium]
MVLALNMMDEVWSNGGTIDVALLSDELGIPVVPIAAAKNDGIEELIDRAIEAVQQKHLPRRLEFCSGAVHRCIHALV